MSGFEVKTGSATSVRFPVYDGHGNMTGCLLRDGAGGFTLTSRRAYDPWGAMRQWGTHPSGASAYQGAPSNRYVGSLGHQQDDDSGLYYMRARYYEPGSGRFISQDPAMDGLNWFAYCGNDPIQRLDPKGTLMWAVTDLMALVFGILSGLVFTAAEGTMLVGGSAVVGTALLLAAAICTVVGAITTVEFFRNFGVEYAANQPLLLMGPLIVESLKTNGAAMAGHQLEILFAFMEIGND